MSKQTITIECPEGTKAVFDEETQKIEFVPLISTVTDARHKLCPNKDLGVSVAHWVKSLNLTKFIELQIVLKALNGPDFKWNLIEGKIWYPWVRFIREDRISKEKWSNEKVVGHFMYEGTRYALMGGQTGEGGSVGLGRFASGNGVGSAAAHIGFLSCKDEATARYVSEHFGKLVFEATTAFKLDDIKWLD